MQMFNLQFWISNLAKKKIILTGKIAFAIILIGNLPSYSQTNAADSIKQNKALVLKNVAINFDIRGNETNSINVFKKSYSDSKQTVLSPLHWKKRDWAIASTIMGGAGLALLYDEEILHFIQKPQQKEVHNISNILEHCGRHQLHGLAFLTTYGAGWIFDNNKAKNLAIMGVESIVISGVITQAVKIGAGRARPNSNTPQDAYDWGLFSGNHSFFSGHTTVAFSSATVISQMFKEQKWVGYASYAIATGIGISRIYDNKHWASDVIIGAAVGTAVGRLVVNNFENNGLKFLPYATSNGNGISLSYKF